MAIAPAKKLTSLETKEILSLTRDEITMEKIRELFACYMGNAAPRFNTYDSMILPARTLYNNETIMTTIGRYITNFVIMPIKFLNKYGYVNIPLTKKELGKIEDQMGDMVLNDEMSVKEYAAYLDTGEWLGMGSAYFLCPTMDYDMNVPIPEVIAKRDELFDKYKEGIKRGDSAVAEKIEKEVTSLAKKKIQEKGNEGYDFFASGVGKFENNYKKTSIMAGAVENPYTHKLDILKSNYIDGIDPKEFPKFTNLTVVGGYSRGVETQKSGYERKKIDNAMQCVTLDDDGSDCGTNYALRTIIPEKLKNLFLNRYVVDGDIHNPVLLTSENIDKYTNKEILLRSPMFCKGDKICSKCAGELFYKLGVKNPGLLNDTMSGVLMNASMKKFHDATVKFTDIKIEDYIKKR